MREAEVERFEGVGWGLMGCYGCGKVWKSGREVRMGSEQ